MAFQIGQSNAVFDQWESDSIEVEFGYRKPTHPEVLDIELEAAEFNEKWKKWERDKAALFAELHAVTTPDDDPDETLLAELISRLDEGARKTWRPRFSDLKSSISSDDIRPVFQFISAHLITIDGVLGTDGKSVKAWADLDAAAQLEIMGAITPYEVAELYGEIKRSVQLKASEKKP